MAVVFDGVDDVLSFGTLSTPLRNIATGAYTVATLIKRTSGGSGSDWDPIYGFKLTSTPATFDLRASAEFQSTTFLTMQDEGNNRNWTHGIGTHANVNLFVVITAPSGSPFTFEASILRLDTMTWFHGVATTTGTTRAAMSSTAVLQFGQGGSDFLGGRVGVFAAWQGVYMNQAARMACASNLATSDMANHASGAPHSLIEFTSLTPTDLAGGVGAVVNSSAPTLDNTDAMGWTFNGLGGYRSTILGTSGLTGAWDLDGTTITDLVGTNTGTVVGSPSVVPGLVTDGGNARSFVAASSQEVTLPGPLLSTNGSIEFWYTSPLNSASGVVFRDHTSSGGWLVGLNGGANLLVRVGGTTITTTVTSAAASTGTHHVVVAKTGAAVTVYFDGVSVGTSAAAANTSSVTPWHLSRNGNPGGAGDYVNSTIDWVAIYNRALTATEAAFHYAVGTAVAPGVGTFNESGVTFNDSDSQFNNFIGGPTGTPITSSDSITLSEAASVAVSISGTDSATLTEARTLERQSDVTDSMTLSEARSIAATLTSADSATLSEGVPDLSIQTSKTGSDSLTLSEALAISAAAAAADSGVLSEARAISASAAAADSAALSEAASAAIAAAASDSATLSESPAVTTQESKTSSDSATLSEAASAAASTAASDSAALSEARTISAAASASDSAALSEARSISAAAAATDSGTLSESPSVASVDVKTGSDSGTLSEAASTSAAAAATDTGTLSESPSISAAAAAADAGTLSESASALSFDAKTASDSGTLSESPSVLSIDAKAASDNFLLSEARAISATVSATDAAALTEAASIAAAAAASEIFTLAEFAVGGQQSDIFASDNFVLTESTLVPTTRMVDTYTDVSGTLLQNHVADTLETWTRHPQSGTNNTQITPAGRLRPAASNTTSYYFANETGLGADYTVSADIIMLTSVTSTVGIYARMSASAHTGYAAYLNGSTGWSLTRFVANSATVLASGSTTLLPTAGGAARNLSLQVIGDRIIVRVNGTLIYDVVDATPILTAGQPGLRMQNATASDAGGVHIDNYGVAAPVGVLESALIDVSDGFTLSEALDLQAQITQTDSGALSESVGLVQQILKTGIDSGTLSEDAQVVVSIGTDYTHSLPPQFVVGAYQAEAAVLDAFAHGDPSVYGALVIGAYSARLVVFDRATDGIVLDIDDEVVGQYAAEGTLT